MRRRSEVGRAHSPCRRCQVNTRRTVAFWGAGATASLGIRTTAQQSEFVLHLAGDPPCKPLRERVKEALGDDAAFDPWIDALSDLLAVLGDGQPPKAATTVDGCALGAMARSWVSEPSDDLRQRALHLRTIYNWPALASIIRACPGSKESAHEGQFKINDLQNLLDLYGGSDHGFHAGDIFLTPQMVGSAKSALKMLLQTMFFIDWQVCLKGKRKELDLYYEFSIALARRMQRQGVALAEEPFESSKFYLGDLSFVSMNWDPVGLWCQMIADRYMNRSASGPHIGTPARKLKVFLDQAHFVAGRRVGKQREVWHSMNESAVQRLNEIKGNPECIRVMKYLQPHGCICWRECPSCGKLSNYLSDDGWVLDSPTLIPPPPLRAFEPGLKLENAWNSDERKTWKRGETDARACVHCETTTHAHNTSILMQSNFKARPPSFIEEIQREMRVIVKKAQHVVLLGYSLPSDDVEYRAFLAAQRQGSEGVKCTVVDKKDDYGRWVGPAELSRIRKNGGLQSTAVGAAQDIFGRDNVRFYGGGIPEVFCEHGEVTDRAVERLFKWEGDPSSLA